MRTKLSKLHLLRKWVEVDRAMVIVFLVMGLAAFKSIELAVKVYQEANRPAELVVLNTNFGEIEIHLNDATVKTKTNFVKLVREHFYNGLRFHRIVPGFAIQTGDPLSKNSRLAGKWGTGGPGYATDRETKAGDKVVRGSVIMVNEGGKDNGSQFMIVVTDCPWLDGRNTILGQVVKGMEVVDAIDKIPTGVTGVPTSDVFLLSALTE